MKKTLLVLVVSFVLLSGCSSKVKPEAPTQPEVPTPPVSSFVKIDESKPYIYTEDISPITLEEYVEKLGVTYVNYDGLARSFKDRYSDLVNGDSVYGVERIVLNFVSDDAKRIQKTLDQYSQEALDAINAKIAGGFEETSWESNFLYDLVETDTYLSFTVEHVSVAFNSHGLNYSDMFVFSKDSGKLLSNGEILALANKDQSWLEGQINETIDSMNATNDGKISSAAYYDPEMAEAFEVAIRDYFDVYMGLIANGGDATDLEMEFEGDTRAEYIKIQDEHALSLDGRGNVKLIIRSVHNYGMRSNPGGEPRIWVFD